MKKILVSVMSIVLVFSLSACGGKDSGKKAIDDKNAIPLTLVATPYKFDKKVYKIEKGQTVKFILDAQQGVHGVHIEGLDVNLDMSNTTQVAKADKAGTYTISCNVPCGPGHDNMQSKLVVQ